MPEVTETSLLEQARAGDRDAFAQLQATLEGPARRFVRRLIGRHDGEDDIVQNAFFALYLNLDRLEDGEMLRPFLFRVLRNQCYDELRAQGRYDAVSMDDDSQTDHTETVADEQPQPEEKVHWLLLYGQVHQAIESLPEVQRQTLLLYTAANLSYAEIAQTMGTSIGTVKSRLYYAKRNLVQRLPRETLAALDVADGDDDGNAEFELRNEDDGTAAARPDASGAAGTTGAGSAA